MRHRWVVIAIVASGCGRLAFDEQPDARPTPDVQALDETSCDELTGMLLCESFEATLPAELVPQADLPATVGVVANRAYRGSRSLHSHTEQTAKTAWLISHILGGLTTGDLYARFYLYRAPGAGEQSFAALHLVENVFPFHGVIFSETATTAFVTATEQDITDTVTVTLPTDQWTCVQMHVVISPTAGMVETFVDGAPLARLEGVDTLPAGGYSNAHLGSFAGGADGEAIDVWTDEVAIATAPIACD